MNISNHTKKLRKKQVSNRHKYVWRNMLEHVLIAERLLGRELRKGVEIHHVDGNGRNNAHSNLVICPDHGYHSLLHMRTEAIDACGNPSWRKCSYCKKWDAPERLAFWKRGSVSGTVIAHRECANDFNRAYKERNPEWVARNLAKRRKQYAENAELRESIKAANRKRYERLKAAA